MNDEIKHYQDELKKAAAIIESQKREIIDLKKCLSRSWPDNLEIRMSFGDRHITRVIDVKWIDSDYIKRSCLDMFFKLQDDSRRYHEFMILNTNIISKQ